VNSPHRNPCTATASQTHPPTPTQRPPCRCWEREQQPRGAPGGELVSSWGRCAGRQGGDILRGAIGEVVLRREWARPFVCQCVLFFFCSECYQTLKDGSGHWRSLIFFCWCCCAHLLTHLLPWATQLSHSIPSCPPQQGKEVCEMAGIQQASLAAAAELGSRSCSARCRMGV